MVMTVFQYTASMPRHDILDQRTRKPLRTEFEPIRRRHRLQTPHMGPPGPMGPRGPVGMGPAHMGNGPGQNTRGPAMGPLMGSKITTFLGSNGVFWRGLG